MTDLSNDIDQRVRLVRAMADELRLPLLRIAAMAETDYEQPKSYSQIHATAKSALKLIDNYVLSTQVFTGQMSLDLEPTPLGAVLYDSADTVRDFARMHGVDIDIESTKRAGLVMGHKEVLHAALTSLAYSFINSTPGVVKKKRPKIVFGSTLKDRQVLSSVLVSGQSFSSSSLDNAKKLLGRAVQPMPKIMHTSAAGIFVADALLQCVGLKTEAYNNRGLSGFGTMMVPSSQTKLL